MSEEFRKAILAFDMLPPIYIPTGRWIRFAGAGKKSSNKSAWAYLFPDEKGGVFGDWSADVSTQVWQAECVNTYSKAELAAHHAAVALARADAERQRDEEYAEAAIKAKAEFEASDAASDSHPYLVKKGVKAYGIRQRGNDLIVPLYAPSVQEGSSLLFSETTRLKQSLERITGIANRRGIVFDGSPVSIAHLERLEDVLPSVVVNDTVIAKAQQAANYILAELSLTELNKRQHELHLLCNRIDRALNEIEGIARQIGLPFDTSQKTIAQLIVLCLIASQAPAGLLDYRHASLAHPKIFELLTSAEKICTSEKSQREALASIFYMDALPSSEKLKAAIRTFRRGDNLFNFFKSDWREAKRFFYGICKIKSNRKAADFEAQLSRIITWQEHRAAFITNKEFKEAIGPMFNGLETDFSKIHQLHGWYVKSHAEMRKHPGFLDSVDLSKLDSHKISQSAALYPRLQTLSIELDTCHQEAMRHLSPASTQLESVLQQTDWAAYKQRILQMGKNLKDITTFLGRYVKPEISPKYAVQALSAKLEIVAAKEDFDALNRGLETIQEGVEPLLHGVASITCVNWGDYLAQLTRLAQAADEVGEMSAKYGKGDSTPENIRSFFEAKLALDVTLEKFAALPRGSAVTSWESYIDVASRRLTSADKLVVLLKPAGKMGNTAKEVMVGLTARKEAVEIIQRFNNDIDVTTMLQNLLQGVNTDLESLAATLSWGEVVIENKSVSASSLRTLLLAPGAAHDFHWARQVLQNIAERHESFKRKLHELGTFGAFNWDVWNWTGEMQAKNLFERIKAAANDIEAVLPWSKYYVYRVDVEKTDIGDFVVRLEQKTLPPLSVGSVFEYVAFRSIGKKIYGSYPELVGFFGSAHEKKRSEFVALDKEIISLTGKSYAHDIDKAKNVPDGDSGYRASERTATFNLEVQHHEKKQPLLEF